MSNEQAFLQTIIEKIEQKLAETNASIKEGQKDIEQMHDYYWESYTEMDEYGYEVYDNQQALRQQVNANQEAAQYRHRLKRMLEEPYFGRVDFRFEDEEDAESFYIGIGNFAERTGAMPLVYDWRAPVSALFYDYDSGPAVYQAPAGEITGEVTSKWQYKIKNGKLIYAFESDTKIDDSILKEEIGKNGDVKLKQIVRTIQKEQNEIIRNTKDKILVIQGAAGSGKTSIALHRIAYLLYHDRERLKSSNVLVLSPNGVFSDYISHILPELGEENIQEMSFDIFAYRELKGVAADTEDRYDELERMMICPNPKAKKQSEEKQSPAMLGLVESYLAFLEDDIIDFRDMEYRGHTISEERMIKLFYEQFSNNPLLKRMDVIRDYFIDEYETLKGKELLPEEKDFLIQKFDRLYVTKDIYKIYNRMMEFGGYEPLPDVPYEERKIPYEDVYPMLYLKYRLMGQTRRKQIRHLVIDEMQDYTYLQYEILNNIFSCSMTILGDRAQTLEEEARDVMRFLPKIYDKPTYLEIKKSYRNTLEIAEYAKKLTGVTGLELLDRHGKDVCEETFATRAELTDRIAEEVTEGDFETRAIIAMTAGRAKKIYRELKNRGMDVREITKDSTSFPKGVIVTTWYLAKGLEFDQVIGVFPKEDNEYKAQAKYITATRALHELSMFEY